MVVGRAAVRRSDPLWLGGAAAAAPANVHVVQ